MRIRIPVRFKKVEIPVTSEFTRWSWFKINLAGGLAVHGMLGLVRLLLRRLKMKIHIGSRTETVWIYTDVTFSDIEDRLPLPVWSPE